MGHHLHAPCTSKIVTLGYGYNLAPVHRIVSQMLFSDAHISNTQLRIPNGNKEVIKRGLGFVTLLLGWVVLTIRRVTTRPERSLLKVKELNVSYYENDTTSVLSICSLYQYLRLQAKKKSIKSVVCLFDNIQHTSPY